MRKSIAYDYTIIFNLKEYAKGIYLPSAYIASRKRDGELLYIQQKASKKTIAAYDIQPTDSLLKLFQLIEKLDIKVLEKKYNPPRRKPKPLLDIMNEDRIIERSIIRYMHQAVDAFLSKIVLQKHILCWDIEKKVLIKDVQVFFAKDRIHPKLSFKKTATNVLYNLQLRDRTGTWQVKEKEVIPITNSPAWVFIDYKLYKIEHINGFMLKPFQKKNIVNIPAQHVKNYFKSFILNIASEVEMQTEGFEVINDKVLQYCQLELVEDIFTKNYGLKVEFAYSGVKFTWNDQTKRRSGLKFDQDEIIITRINRDFEKEKDWIAKLKSFGLTIKNGNYFQPIEAPNTLFAWLAKNKTTLIKAGFKVISPNLNGKEILIAVPKISFDTQQINDWFDIKGLIEVGEFKIPFKKIAKYIKKGDKYYPLPNGKYFLIPAEWFTRFKNLVQFAKHKEDRLQLAKSQYPLLEELGINISAAVDTDYQEVEYQTPKELKATLRPYQLEGVKWLLSHYRNELGACLADDMGLGKTLQTIAVLLYVKAQRSVKNFKENSNKGAQLDLFQASAYPNEIYQPLQSLIILPASLVFNWEREIKKFAPSLMVYKHLGAKRHRNPTLLSSFDVLLTTYHTALRDIQLLREVNYQYIILDESQQIKNKDSKIFKALNELKGAHKISLSGTPIENSLSDLWAQMQFINPDLLGSFHFFKNTFIRPIEKQNDEAAKEYLQKLIKPYLLRRTKEAVAKDLPSLITKVFYTIMTPAQKKYYEKEKSAVRNFLLKNFDATDGKYQFMVLKSLTKLRQIANHPILAEGDYENEAGKFQDVLEHLDVIHKGGHKVLLFSSFVKHLALYKKQFEQIKKDFSWLTGDLSQKERKKQIDQFEKNTAVQSFLISIKAGGTGLNLTAADYVFILDPWWNPSIEKQAIARAHRIGQTKNVFAIKFITKDSIEEKILKLQERKARLAEEIIEGKGKNNFSKEDLKFLLS